MMNETNRIISYFEKRDKNIIHSKRQSSSYLQQASDKLLLELLKDESYLDRTFLDVGCGAGKTLWELKNAGVHPGKLTGIDLVTGRLTSAKLSYSEIGFSCANAAQTPFMASQFDYLIMNTMMSSVLDSNLRVSIAKEALWLLKSQGKIIWYDFILNPLNPHTRGIGLKEIKKLFPNCKYSLKRCTLAPPLARLIAPFSLNLCKTLEKIPWLCFHYFGTIEKQGD